MPGASVSNAPRDQKPAPAFTAPVSTSSTLNTILSVFFLVQINESTCEIYHPN